MPRTCRLSATWVIVTLLALLPSTVGAQAGADDEVAPELVYAASRYAQTLAEAPAPVSLITREEIRAYGWRTLGEILESVVGFYYTYDRAYGYVTVRGLSTLGDSGSRILVMMNGHRINRVTWEDAGFGYDGLIDVSMIERVEVIRGSGSSMFGTNALYSVINIVTRRGSDVDGFEAEAAWGEYSTWDAALAFGGRVEASGLEYVVSVNGYESDGPDLYFAEFDDPEIGDGWARGLDWDEVRRAYAQLKIGDFAVDAAWMDRDKSIPTASYEVDFGDPRTQTRDTQTMVSLRYERSFMDLSRVWASLSYNDAEYNGDWIYEDSLFHDYTNDRVWTVEAQYQFHLGGHSFTVGGEARDVQSELGSYDVDPVYVYQDEAHDYTSKALFAQGELRFGSRVVVVAGVRWDDYETFGSTTNPRLAMVVTLAEGSSLKAMVNEAFRAPSPSELYYHDGYNSWKPSEGLDAETTRSYELALEHRFSPRLRGSASVYHLEIDDIISLVEDPEDELLVYRNLDFMESTGVELEVSGRVLDNLDLRVGYAYQDSEDRDGADLPGAPSGLGRLGLVSRFLDDSLSAALEARYVSSRQRRDGLDEDAFITARLNLRYRPFADERLELIATVNNLFDEDYAHVVADDHEQEVLTMNGRTYRIGARVRFGGGR